MGRREGWCAFIPSMIIQLQLLHEFNGIQLCRSCAISKANYKRNKILTVKNLATGDAIGTAVFVLLANKRDIGLLSQHIECALCVVPLINWNFTIIY